MAHVFLIGGGWDRAVFDQMYAPFLRAAAENGTTRIAVIVAEEPGVEAEEQFKRFAGALAEAGADPKQLSPIYVSSEKPLTFRTLEDAGPTGIFVCGGLTPAYHDGLCRDTEWVTLLDERSIPYCGFSAGAAIAAKGAIVGGWKRSIGGTLVDVANSDAGEDLELLDVRPGLALVPFAVEVHATQWGTLSRLVHVIDSGMSSEGWAIDENTMMETSGDGVVIHGVGNAYRVYSDGGRTRIDIHQSKAETP
jgi:cyanophycinase